METPQKSIYVNIFGEEYPLRSGGDSDVEYMSRVAGYVDQSMRKIAKNSPHLTTGNVAILAALNITDELFSARNKTDKRMTDLNGRARRLQEWLAERLAAGHPSKARIPLS